MAERWPPGLIKRWPGYGIERFLRVPNDLTNILAGSEGTLAAIFSAELKISPLPHEKGLGLIFFASVAEAMQATVELLDLKPAAIEHIDRPLFDGTKGQLQFQAARDLLELESKPCESILIVEFYDDVAERLSVLQSRKIGLRTKILTDPAQMNMVWSVRKSGLSLLTGCIGPAKPVAFIEDAAVRPGAIARLRARFAINHETAGPDGELLRACRHRTFACATGARYAQRQPISKNSGKSQTKLPRWFVSSKVRSPPSTASASRAPNICATNLAISCWR